MSESSAVLAGSEGDDCSGLNKAPFPCKPQKTIPVLTYYCGFITAVLIHSTKTLILCNLNAAFCSAAFYTGAHHYSVNFHD